MSVTWVASKDPDEVKDYFLDWTAKLAGDPIVSSVWTLTDGDGSLVLSAPNFTTTRTTIWFSGGTLGIFYAVRNRVVTGGGRTYDETANLKVRAK